MGALRGYSPRTPAPPIGYSSSTTFTHSTRRMPSSWCECPFRKRGQMTSLTNAIPAVNWQEREIQDLFGIKLIGHPNPRRCVLHDDWPEVYPLRKDFDA